MFPETSAMVVVVDEAFVHEAVRADAKGFKLTGALGEEGVGFKDAVMDFGDWEGVNVPFYVMSGRELDGFDLGRALRILGFLFSPFWFPEFLGLLIGFMFFLALLDMTSCGLFL